MGYVEKITKKPLIRAALAASVVFSAYFLAGCGLWWNQVQRDYDNWRVERKLENHRRDVNRKLEMMRNSTREGQSKLEKQKNKMDIKKTDPNSDVRKIEIHYSANQDFNMWVYRCETPVCNSFKFLTQDRGKNTSYTINYSGAGLETYCAFSFADCFVPNVPWVKVNESIGEGPWKYNIKFVKDKDCYAPINSMSLSKETINGVESVIVSADIDSVWLRPEGLNNIPSELRKQYSNNVEVYLFVDSERISHKQLIIPWSETKNVEFTYTPEKIGPKVISVRTHIENECACENSSWLAKSGHINVTSQEGIGKKSPQLLSISIPKSNSTEEQISLNSKLGIIISYQAGIYKSKEIITTDAGVITLNSLRLELSDGKFNPDIDVTFALENSSAKEKSIAKGSKEVFTRDLRSSFTYQDVKLSGLKVGENILKVSLHDNRGRKHSAIITIKRYEPAYQKIAILMGVKQYEWDPIWKKEFVEKDLASMKKVLEGQGYAISTLTNPSVGSIEALLRKLRATNFTIKTDEGENLILGKNDDLILYFTGHGYRINPGQENEYGVIVPFDAKFNKKLNQPDESSCIAMNDIVNNLKLCKARHKLFIIDSCYAALAGIAKSPPEPPKSCDRKFIEQKGLYLMAASEKDEKSWMYKNMQQSAFTKRLVEALGGKTQPSDSSCITLFDIAGYVNRYLEQQSPVFRFLSKENGMPYFENLGVP